MDNWDELREENKKLFFTVRLLQAVMDQMLAEIDENLKTMEARRGKEKWFLNN